MIKGEGARLYPSLGCLGVKCIINHHVTLTLHISVFSCKKKKPFAFVSISSVSKASVFFVSVLDWLSSGIELNQSLFNSTWLFYSLFFFRNDKTSSRYLELKNWYSLYPSYFYFLSDLTFNKRLSSSGLGSVVVTFFKLDGTQTKGPCIPLSPPFGKPSIFINGMFSAIRYCSNELRRPSSFGTSSSSRIFENESLGTMPFLMHGLFSDNTFIYLLWHKLLSK